MKNDAILNLTKEILDVMGVLYQEVKITEEDSRVKVSIYTNKDSKILIGKRGATLFSLSFIINIIVKKKIGEDNQVFVDVNDYQKENLNTIKQKALTVAERVKSFQMDMELEPMNSFERRFVHSLFDDKSGVETKSKGFGEERRVVVMLKK